MVSLSVVSGQGYLNHNERKFSRSNIDKSRSNLNQQIFSDSLDIAYKKLFSDSIEEYNQKQKRSDRKKSVEQYLQELENGKHKRGAEKPFYETIVQIGDKDTCGIIEHPKEAEKAKQALLKYIETWSERNPNLHIFNATLHMDEATPHLHIDYIPVASGYKQGIKTRNSLSKALELQGLGKGKGQFDNASIKWHDQERNKLNEIAREFGFEIEVKGEKRNRLTVAEYKAVSDKLEEKLNENISIDLNQTVVMGKVILSKEHFDRFEKNAEELNKLKAINRVIHEKLLEKERDIKEKAKYNSQITKELKIRESLIKEKEAYCDELEKLLKHEYKQELMYLKSRYEADVLTKSISLSSVINNQRIKATMSSNIIEREKELRVKEAEYESIKEYLPKAKELLVIEKEKKQLEIERKAKEERELEQNREYLQKDFFVKNKRETVEPQGSNIGLLYCGKETIFTVYENGVAVDLNSNRYYISDIAKYNKDNKELVISDLKYCLDENKHKIIKNSFESDSKRRQQEMYQEWYKVACESVNTDREPEGKSKGFACYGGHHAFNIYENGVVVDSNSKKYNLTDFANVDFETKEISVVNLKWSINENNQTVIESAFKNEKHRVLNMLKTSEISPVTQFIKNEQDNTQKMEKRLSELKKGVSIKISTPKQKDRGMSR